jgi:hypothetical protein
VIAENASHHLRFFRESEVRVRLLDPIMKGPRWDLIIVLNVVPETEKVHPMCDG